MSTKFHGQQRDEILNRLVNEWLVDGYPVAILQGFPGCGKTQLALVVAKKAPRSIDPVQPQRDSADPVVDLFLDLAIILEAHGLPGLVQEIDKGGQANLDRALLNLLRHEQILIVIDEFQRLLPKDKSTPPPVWAKLVEDLNNSPHAQGRLLLISNRLIKTERWSENCWIEELGGLPDQDAEALFTELLESKKVAEKVPQERRREIAHRLAGNPRALKTLVGGLRTESLEDLLSAAPDLTKPGDVVLAPELVEDFEREVLERALPKLEADLLRFMRWLSVHRRPFKKEALAQFTGGRDTPGELRKQLFDRFLLESVAGGDVSHPLAREISVTRLRNEGKEWKKAHSLAAAYYFRHFKARQQRGESNLAISYAELRHHLFEAERIGELYEASERLTQYAISQIGLTTPVPTNREALEARIALLSVLPDSQRPKVLEYHLARCFLKRRAVGDRELALKHSRRGTGRHPHSAAWILRINLEYELNGIDTALPVINEALVAAREDTSPIYQRGAEMMAKDNRLSEAITLLEKGIATPGMANLFALYQSCAEMMAKDNRLSEAITLLEKGIATPGMANLFALYQSCAEMMAKAGDYSKAEALVKKGLAAIPKSNSRHKIAETALRLFSARRDTEAIQRLLSGTGLHELDTPQRALAEYLLVRLSGDWAKAAEVAHKGHVEIPNYLLLRIQESDARLALGQVQQADELMKDYQPEEQQVRDNPAVWFKAYVSLLAGRPDEAKILAAMYAPNDSDPGGSLDEVAMLHLWAVARNGQNASVEGNFPGLTEYRRQIAAQSQTTEEMPVLQTSKQTCILAVATEWDSRHGGLSTFNRDLCGALADAGARVVCYVPEASAEERQRASEVKVEIVAATKMPGIKGAALLVYPPVLPADFLPDVVIGHDRITGAASVALAKYHYSSSKRVLFIHTSPEEIEWHKEPREDSTSAERAAERKQEQLDLAEECDLVVAVGPRLVKKFGTDLLGLDNHPQIIELTSGLPRYSPREGKLPPSIRCLILGRVEDYTLKGLDLAARALGRVVEKWRNDDPPSLIVRGAPEGTGDALRERVIQDGKPSSLDVVIRHYTPEEKEIRSDLREASLVLMPSQKEGFGLVGLEAIACGVPTLISAQSGLADTLKWHAPDLASEWILPVTGDAVTKWAERMEFLLTGREGAFARAAALREKLAAELNWKQAAAELLEKIAIDRRT